MDFLNHCQFHLFPKNGIANAIDPQKHGLTNAIDPNKNGLVTKLSSDSNLASIIKLVNWNNTFKPFQNLNTSNLNGLVSQITNNLSP